jgi:H+/Cl- antiporter ClcA
MKINKTSSTSRFFSTQYFIFLFISKWLFLASIIGVLAGTASAGFLISLDFVTLLREENLWIIALLPFGGFLIGLVYYYADDAIGKGNNLLIEQFYKPDKKIPILMIPLVLVGTLITHLFGGSAGREGTAVQMGGAIADQFTAPFRLRPRDRKILLTCGISAGFASVFGTPLAGAVFALEVLIIGRIRYEAIFPVFIAAFIADYVCHSWGVFHLQYEIFEVPIMSPLNILYTIFAGIAFGLVSFLFSKTTHFWSDFFKSKIRYAPFRPLIGGVVIAIAVYLLGHTRYIGLGIPIIIEAFDHQLNSYDFLIKLLFTAFTLGAGFKGGEVTPLFFVGACLGNALFWIVPLPLSLLAGMGFVAVFCGATNTPIACTLMAIELFGAESALYTGLACVVAYLFSGHSGIYQSQIVGSPKHLILGRDKYSNRKSN